MNAVESTTVRTPADALAPEFDGPPADPIVLFGQWRDRAVEQGVLDAGAMALATADRHGRTSNRTVQLTAITADGLVFTSHIGSQKGRDLAATGWASAVLYWRETKQQVILTGAVQLQTRAESDAVWARRPIATHAMSVASVQSAPLEDEEALRAEARRLADTGKPLTRPANWAAYLLVPETVEFWQASPDRLHRRLRYDRTAVGWSTQRLQP